MPRSASHGTVKRNYSFDRETVARFEDAVPKGARSQVLEELMAKRVAEVEATRLRERIVEGLADMADVYAETARQWAPLDAEAWPVS